MPLGAELDVVLGNAYLGQRRVLMDLHQNCMLLTKGLGRYLLQSMASAGVRDCCEVQTDLPRPKGNFICSATAAKRNCGAGSRSSVVMVSPVAETTVSGDGSNQSTDAGMTSTQDALQDLLAQYKDVFEEIQGMPPVRRHTIYHTIPLEEGIPELIVHSPDSANVQVAYRMLKQRKSRGRCRSCWRRVSLSLAPALRGLLFCLCKKRMDP